MNNINEIASSRYAQVQSQILNRTGSIQGNSSISTSSKIAPQNLM